MNQKQPPSIVGRIFAAFLGGAAGAVGYIGWVLFLPIGRASSPEAWSLSGQVRWFVLGGFLLGALGGWPFAQRLWSWAVDDLHSQATSWGAVVLGIIALAAIVGFAIKLHAA